jgi:hypothetical protein
MPNFIQYAFEQSGYWWVNQVGILLEVVGAIIIVLAAFATRSKIKDIRDTYDAELPEKLRDVIANQAITELWGFGLLSTGLMGQLIGGFG